jgi:hypothetical protein
MDIRFSATNLSASSSVEYDHQTGELTLYASGQRWDMEPETVSRLYDFLQQISPDLHKRKDNKEQQG